MMTVEAVAGAGAPLVDVDDVVAGAALMPLLLQPPLLQISTVQPASQSDSDSAAASYYPYPYHPHWTTTIHPQPWAVDTV